MIIACPSLLGYAAMSGFIGRSPGLRWGNRAPQSFAWMSTLFAHAPAAISDVLTFEPSPLRSRR